jgi:Flp pilus assembly protein TadB
MRGDKEHQEICVVGRLFSLEALVFLMGVVSLVYGLVTGRLANIIIGALILVVTALLARLWRRVQLNKRPGGNSS